MGLSLPYRLQPQAAAGRGISTISNDAALKNTAKMFKLVYYAYGREDFVVRNTDQLKGTLNKYNIKFTLHETGGGHT
jgi:hypothetical protein